MHACFLRLILNVFVVYICGCVGGRQKTCVRSGAEFELQLWKAAVTNIYTGFKKIFIPIKSSEVYIRLVLMILLLSGYLVKKNQNFCIHGPFSP